MTNCSSSADKAASKEVSNDARIAPDIYHVETTILGQPAVLAGEEGDPYLGMIAGREAIEPFLIWAFQRVPAGGTVIDIGANIGVTAIAASKVAGRVVAFEPSPRTGRHLAHNLERNGLASVQLVPMAVGAAEGSMAFFENAVSGSASHLLAGSDITDDQQQVPITTLDGFVRKNAIKGISLIKLDIEGFEIDALSGAQATLRDMRPALFVEFNAFTMLAFRDQNPLHFLRFLTSTFPYTYRWREGRPERIASEEEHITFLHDHLVHPGGVDDLYCSFEPASAQ
jgi:FkbM family methyltransferase